MAAFTTTAHGKWILCGEHAVLRGHPALVFPVPNRHVVLEYSAGEEKASAEFKGDDADTVSLLFWGLIEQALQHLEKTHEALSGRFVIHNSIPIGCGMGFSAALCVAVTRFFVWKGWVGEKEIFTFARLLENHFHGQSSGVDIVGAMHDVGMLFQNGAFEPVEMKWQPLLYLSFSNQLSMTAQCVQKVRTLLEKNPALARDYDAEMAESVFLARDALTCDAERGFSMLTAAINKAHMVFLKWGLVPGDLERHLQDLLNAGAVAAKPTGAGDGGYVLSLWAAPPADASTMLAV